MYKLSKIINAILTCIEDMKNSEREDLTVVVEYPNYWDHSVEFMTLDKHYNYTINSNVLAFEGNNGQWYKMDQIDTIYSVTLEHFTIDENGNEHISTNSVLKRYL